MFLKTLTLAGFKSFRERVTLELTPGITCFVGPNGSGKSNIVDAIIWAMGEQGASSMRGSTMGDLVFAGSSSWPPLGRAEVTITFENLDRRVGSSYTDLQISRRISTNGVSEYSISGERCRLVDVQELLSDAGLGREMHSIVGQGQLDKVLRSTTLEKRALIEEAAGVLKYRRRREKTERKLAAMQANLTRLQDLTVEVKRSLRPLGRQADAARQAREISAEIRMGKAQLYALQLESLQQLLETASNEEVVRKSEAALSQSQLEIFRRALVEAESNLDQASTEGARKRLFALESLELSIKSSRAFAQQNLSLAAEITSSEPVAKLEEVQRDLEQLQMKKAELLIHAHAAENLKRAASRAKSAAFEQLETFDSEAEQYRLQAEERNAVRAKREGDLRALESATALTQDALESQSGQWQSLLTEIKRLEGLKRESEIDSESSADSVRARYEASRKKEAESRVSIDKTREKLNELEKRRDVLAAKHAALGQMLENPDGAANLIKAKLKGIEGLFADQVEVKPGYEKAVVAALGPLANAVTVNSREAAFAALSHLWENDLGRAELVITGLAAQGTRRWDLEVTPLLSVMEGPAELQFFLKNYVVANDLEEARQLLETLRDDSVIVVTTNGDYLSRNLVRGGGASDLSKVEIISEREKFTLELAYVGKEIEKSTDSFKLLRDAQVALNEEVNSNLKELREKDAESAKVAENHGRLIAQLGAAQTESTRLERSITQLKERLQQQSQVMITIHEELDGIDQTTTTFDSGVRTQLVEHLEMTRRSETDAQIEVGAIKERLAASEREEQSLNHRLKILEEEKEEWARKLQSKEQQVRNSRKVLVTCDLLLHLMESLIAKGRADLRELETLRQNKATRLSELRHQIGDLEARAIDLGITTQEAEMKTYQLKLQHQSVTEKIVAELTLTPEELVEEITSLEVREPKTEDELRETIRRSENRIAQLGAYNPLALEEFAALEERHKYLTEQLADLKSARNDLDGIIKDLDEKMNIIFLAAFEDTKRAFEEIFPILFPGGTGSISLTHGDEDQATGVEVYVRPAGKRVERPSLLSGGERSLAAIALLIAILKARPSPLCVLDEVEAALDDANLGRLLQVLETLRESSQLIIVTHQKRTMEIADALYGVSMGKDGITRVVGQKLDKAS